MIMVSSDAKIFVELCQIQKYDAHSKFLIQLTYASQVFFGDLLASPSNDLYMNEVKQTESFDINPYKNVASKNFKSLN